ncbi:peptidase inhibitor family I36 protein [Streptomyces sp. DH18]|uniref:peptidase inhibitor family I36 protein n=1 Tax=Streptomyces sp. DH18 TaxID=3040126 RepID=UPI003FA7545D
MPAADCQQGHICLWEHPDFQGFQWGGEGEVTEPNGCADLPLSPGSAINNSGISYYLLQEGTCANPGRTMFLPLGETPRFPWRVGSLSWCKHC